MMNTNADASAEISNLEDAVADLLLILLTSDDERPRTRVRLTLQAHRARLRALRKAR
jgi:hypothetical protein